MVKAPYISLPNLLADKPLVPELIQGQATVTHITAALLPLLDDSADTQQLVDEFASLHQQLRRNASEVAASALVELVS